MREEGGALSEWYKGPTLVEILDTLEPPARLLDSPLRLPVTNVFKGQTAIASGVAVSGRVVSGIVQIGDRLRPFLVTNRVSYAPSKSILTRFPGLSPVPTPPSTSPALIRSNSASALSLHPYPTHRPMRHFPRPNPRLRTYLPARRRDQHRTLPSQRQHCRLAS